MSRNRISGLSAFAWAALTLLSLGLLVLASASRGYDIYDVERGLRILSEQPALVIGGHIAFAWSGAALVFMVLAFYSRLPIESQSYSAQAAVAFGSIAGGLFMFFGLVGGFSNLELSYLQSVRSADYVTGAYLPLTIVMNRVLAAAITISGFWFALANWVMLHSHALPPFVSYLGLVAGALALLGFVLPGGGFSLLGLLLGALWAILVGFRLRADQDYR